MPLPPRVDDDDEDDSASSVDLSVRPRRFWATRTRIVKKKPPRVSLSGLPSLKQRGEFLGGRKRADWPVEALPSAGDTI